VRLFRLAWDLSISAFGGRQTLYEYYFFGDPVRMAGALVGSYDREPYKERINEFLHRADVEGDGLRPYAGEGLRASGAPTV
jgi:4-hydroxyphenylacetate 3-monooxygenase